MLPTWAPPRKRVCERQRYEQLTTVNRGSPCVQFPGTYYIYRDGEELHAFSAECGEAEARNFLRKVIGAYDDACRYTLAWEASNSDPRIGSVWFTGYYTLDT